MSCSISEVFVGSNLTREPNLFLGMGSFLGAMRESWKTFFNCSAQVMVRKKIPKEEYMKNLRPFDEQLQLWKRALVL
jgi:hypothetical protein